LRRAGVLARGGANAARSAQETSGQKSMTQFSFRFPRAFRLKPVGEREEDALSLVTIGACNQSVLVPYSPDLDYVVVSSRGAALSIESRDFRIETLGALLSLVRGCVWRSSSRRGNILNSKSFLFSPSAEKPNASVSPGTTGIQ
jgi:hypothetical protein